MRAAVSNAAETSSWLISVINGCPDAVGTDSAWFAHTPA
jgi:hypothetical protein